MVGCSVTLWHVLDFLCIPRKLQYEAARTSSIPDAGTFQEKSSRLLPTSSSVWSNSSIIRLRLFLSLSISRHLAGYVPKIWCSPKARQIIDELSLVLAGGVYFR